MAPNGDADDDDGAAAELAALVAWLQTLPAFPHRIVSGADGAVALDSVRDALDAAPVAGSLWAVAQELCGPAEDGTTDTDAPPMIGTDLWMALLAWSAARARPLLPEFAPPARPRGTSLRILVLSHLLDCAVQCPDMPRRRAYIHGIMGLDKALQKIIMRLIERRVKPPPKATTPVRDHGEPTPPRSASRRQQQASPASGARSTPRHSPGDSHNGSGLRSRPPAVARPPWASPPGGVGTPRTTPRRRAGDGTGLLSPGTLDSPTAVRAALEELHARNAQLEGAVDALRRREAELQRELDAATAAHRRELVRLETAQRGEAEDLQTELEGRIDQLTTELERFRALAAEGEAALQELALARDELDVLRQRQPALEAANEKLQRLRAKVEELQDVRENYRAEQERHAASVEECIRLENEVEQLRAAKRQLDEYKARAVQAEVQLVQYQDYLQQLEAQTSQQSAVNEVLAKGAAMQKEELEEMRRRLERDTEEMATRGPGLGEGVSEFNPEVVEELTRLRNENLRLKVFASKRQNDAVTRIESALEDARLTADTYKNELLAANKTLASTRTSLNEGLAREKMLKEEMERVQQQCGEIERSRRSIQDELHRCEQRLKLTQEDLTEAEKQLTKAREDVDHWQRRARKLEHESEDLLQKWEAAQQELEETNHVLEGNGKTILKLQEQLASTQLRIVDLEQNEKSLHQLIDEKGVIATELQSQLDESKKSLMVSDSLIEKLRCQLSSAEASVENLLFENTNLLSQFESEKQARLESEEEARASLEAARESLAEEHKRKYDDMLGNMNCKVDDERRASKRKDEEHEKQLKELDNNWRTQYDELEKQLSTTLENSWKDARQQIDALKQDHAAELERYNAEAEESRRLLIERGNRLMDEAKSNATEEIRTLEDKLRVTTLEKEEMERFLREKLHSYKSKNDHAAREILDLTQDKDDLQTKLRNLDREKLKLQEDNDRYRRQLGGNHSGDGSIQAQFEKLQIEYNTVLQENRNLKRDARHAKDMASIPESEASGPYTRSGKRHESYLQQLRREYEEQIDTLNNEKRELVMQVSAAANDVRKAEQRAYEREQDMEKLKLELNDLKLKISRQERNNEYPGPSENLPPAEETTILGAPESSLYTTIGGTPEEKSSERRPRRSPAIDRAFQNRNSQESNLRTKVAMLTGTHTTGTPPPLHHSKSTPTSRKPNVTASRSANDQKYKFGMSLQDSNLHAASKDMENSVLSPSKKPEHQVNQRPKHNQKPSDIFGLGIDASSKMHQQLDANLSDVTKWDQEKRASIADGSSECNQS